MYIMPEAIMIKKVVLHDETTCCVKPELQITLQVDAVAENINGESGSKYSILTKLFRERIVDFYNGHPQEDEVPEVQLPHPFNQTKPSVLPRALNFNFEPTRTESTSSAATQQQFLVPSHIPQSFHRWFSKKNPIPASEKTPLMCLSQAWPKDDLSVSAASSPIKCASNPPIIKKSLLCSSISNTLSSNCRISEEEAHMLVRADNSPPKEPNIPEETPAKTVSIPLRLMCNTPELPTPKRRRPSPSCDSTPLNESLKRSTRTKLFMTPEKSAKAGEEENTGRSVSSAAAADDDDDDDVLDIQPESLL
ncbi:CDT1-like protein a, chloroplastic [Musa acuminata AAA Group]|uniref:CDT1-like protein a, chloroplastic n=1 Tax=Musa acuminata AAA Group TaxID=214697 RepID=UPI0031E0EB50